MIDNRPTSERYHSAATACVEADAAASLLEETRGAMLSDMVTEMLSKNISMAVNRAEALVKSSSRWRAFVTDMVELRRKANMAKVTMEYIRMRHSEEMSQEATHRAASRI